MSAADGATRTLVQRIEQVKKRITDDDDDRYPADDWEVVQPSRKATSILDKHGVRIKAKEVSANGKVVCHFLCLASDGCCFDSEDEMVGTPIKFHTTSTGKATSHLSEVHGITSQKTTSAQQNVARAKNLNEALAPAFEKDPARFMMNALGVWASNHGVACNAFNDQTWNVIQTTFPTTEDALKNFNARKPRLSSLPSTRI